MLHVACRQQRIKDTWADGKEAGKQLLQQLQQEPVLQPAMDLSPRQDGFTHRREPQPAFSQTPGPLQPCYCMLCCAFTIGCCGVMLKPRAVC